jgi:hypothetical protein
VDTLFHLCLLFAPPRVAEADDLSAPWVVDGR